MKISQVIEELQAVQKEYGDLMVCMSKDAEGNGFYRLSPGFFSIGRFVSYDEFDAGDGIDGFVPTDICIWP